MHQRAIDITEVARGHLRDYPYGLHFWECPIDGLLLYLNNPRVYLRALGVDLPESVRVETTIENHDWLAETCDGLLDPEAVRARDLVVSCIGGGGNTSEGQKVYQVILYPHRRTALEAGEQPAADLYRKLRGLR